MPDLRPYLTAYEMEAGAVLASFEMGGVFKVVATTFAGERREIVNLTKPEASATVHNLRKRGYRANYIPMALI